ncbi:NAD(P)-dependent oxidoreductase [Subtercola frigoramans]
MSATAADDDVRIGFIGIGAMGLPMARNLHAAGFHVTAVDPSEKQRELAAALGIATASSVSALSESTLLIIMVASPSQLLGLLDESSLFGDAPRLRTAVVTSTVGPTAVRQFAERAAGYGVDVIDLAVTGGVAGAANGTLTLLTGAPTPTIERVRSVLENLGRITVCGQNPGDGQAVKLVNNLLAAVNLAAVAEAIRFAKGMGLDPKNVVNLVRNGAAASWMLSERGPRMAVPREERDFDTFAAIFAKDTALIAEVATEQRTSVPLLDVVKSQFAEVVTLGWASEDDSCIVDLPL